MKKLLFIFTALLMVNSAMANRIVTFDPAEDKDATTGQNVTADTYTLSKQGVTIFVTKGTITDSQYRLFAPNNDMPTNYISVTTDILDREELYNDQPGCFYGQIVNIKFICTAEGTANYGPGNLTTWQENGSDLSHGYYSYEGNVGSFEPWSCQSSYSFKTISQVRCTQIVVELYANPVPDDPVVPTEKTDAPSSSKENYVYNDGNLYYNAYTVLLIETEPSDIYYRIGVLVEGDYVYGDWMLYTGELNFSEEGTYMIEAYAIAPGKTESDHIWDGFTVSKMVDVEEMFAGKTVANVRYFNMAGQEMQQANGMTIVVTTFTDGTTNAVKVVK